jgi:tetratricopeptide (TPR) repeat protein/predicted Ser/Thr protein kinase
VQERACLSAEEVARYVDPDASTDRGELADHVDRCELCRQVVAAAVRAARSVTRPAGHDDDTHPGDRVERYAVFEPLGVGGMGVVYRAYDPRLDRKIAIKLLRPGLCDETNRERMTREAKMLAKLAHPNVVAVHDAGTWHDRVYIAMELVEGVTLRDWLAEKPRSWREIIDALIQAGEGLASAHAAGLVHRDVKPQNVLIGRDGRARVSDFGLAEAGATNGGVAYTGAVDLSRPAGVSLTATGAVLGTPGYMAPEQLAGGTIDASADQFSFCVTAYEALVGERPFPATTFTELRERINSGKPPDPPRTARVPRRVMRCLLRGLAIDPTRRFASMRALVDELRAARGRSHRVMLTAAAAVIVIGSGGALWAARSASGPSPEEHCTAAAATAGAELWNLGRRGELARGFAVHAVPYARDVEQAAATRIADYAQRYQTQYAEACRATRVTGAQTDAMLDLRMACLDDKRRHADALLAQLSRLDKAQLRAVPDALAALPDVAECENLTALASRLPQPQQGPLAATYDALADELAEINVVRDLGSYEKALAQADRAQPRVDALGHKSLRAKFLYIRGELRDHLGKPDEAARLLEDAMVAAEAARDQETKVTALVRLLVVAATRLDKPAAERWSKLAEAALAAGSASDYLRSYLLMAQGMYAYQADDMPTAATKFEQALALTRRDPDSTLQIGMLTNLASVYYMQERDDDAKRLWDEALAYAQRHYGPQHPHLGLVLGNIALFEATTGDPEHALVHYQQALAINVAALGPSHWLVGKTEQRIADLLAKQPRHAADAVAHYQRAIDILANAFPDGHLDLSEALINHAMFAHGQGDFRGALALYERARVSEEKVRGPDDPALFLVWHGLGGARLELGEAKLAVPLLRRARELRLKATRASPQSLQRIDTDLARAVTEAKRG